MEKYKYLIISLLHFIAGLYLITLIGCAAPAYKVALHDGFDAQWRGYQQTPGESITNEIETIITVKVIVTNDPKLEGAAASYSWDGKTGIIRIPGKMVDGKIFTCPAMIGHEFQHALEYQDGRFINPDTM